MAYYFRRRNLLRRTLLAPALLAILAGCGFAGPMGVSLGPSAAVAQKSWTSNEQSQGQSWKLAWQDNFTSSADLSSKWTAQNNANFGDKMLAWFGSSNATVASQGGLVITAAKGGSTHTCWYGACKYTSAEIQTSFAQEYGRFEARIKLPGGAGLWPAFWMLPAANGSAVAPGELDIIEVPNTDPYVVSGYAHVNGANRYKAVTSLSTPPSSQFHVYALDWTPTGITWTIDGQPYGHLNAYKNWPFDRPYYMLLDLAVGGIFPGSPTASTVFPAQMQVSWVRVYKMTKA